MINVAIIGAGEIGSRHLQALALSDREMSIKVIDPQAMSLKKAKERYEEVNKGNNFHTVRYLNQVVKIKDPVDVAIVSSTANYRRQIIEELIQTTDVKYLLLEKFLFQKIDDFNVIDILLRNKKIKTWVNCPLRMHPVYNYIKRKFVNMEKLSIDVSASNLGITCNSIHYIDLLAYMTNEKDFKFYTDRLNKGSIPSKRKGFVELTGCLCGFSPNGSQISITSYPHGEVPELLCLYNEFFRCIIRETEKKAWISSLEDKWNWSEIPSLTPYQSQLTHIVLHEILDHGKCSLTTYEDSCNLHIQLLKAFISHLGEQELSLCPIT